MDGITGKNILTFFLNSVIKKYMYLLSLIVTLNATINCHRQDLSTRVTISIRLLFIAVFAI